MVQRELAKADGSCGGGSGERKDCAPPGQQRLYKTTFTSAYDVPVGTQINDGGEDEYLVTFAEQYLNSDTSALSVDVVRRIAASAALPSSSPASRATPSARRCTRGCSSGSSAR